MNNYRRELTSTAKSKCLSPSNRNLLATALAGMVLFGTNVSASVITHEFNNGESLSSWTVDRAAPSSFSIVGNELVMSIDGTNFPDSRGAFYDTKGMQLDIGQSNYLSVDMYVDSSWIGNERFAGMWGVGRDASDSISAFPILEFQGAGSNGPDAGINVWDNSGWQGKSNLFNYDAFNTLELMITGSGIEYYLNSNLLHTDSSSNTSHLSAVILNAKNDGNSFDVRYDNLQYGRVSVPEPSTLALMGLGLSGLVVARRRKAHA